MCEQPVSRRSVLTAAAVASFAVPLKNAMAEASGDDEAINVAVITEPTASHRTGYLKVLATCHGVRKVAVTDATGKTFDQSQTILADRFDRCFVDSQQMLEAVKPSLTGCK